MQTPSSRLRSPSPPGPAAAPAALLIALVLICLHVALVLMNPRDPWHDEAMLAYNLVLPDLDLLAPLPYFEQAAPVGYLALTRGLMELPLSADFVVTLRLVHLAFFLAGLGLWTLGLARRGLTLADLLVFAALVLSNVTLWQYASEIKHYGLEFTATALVMLGAWRLALADDLRAHLVFLAAVALAAPLSFMLPVVLGCALFGIVATRGLLRWRGAERPLPLLSGGLIASAAASLGLVGGIYLLLNRGLVQFQTSAYKYIYDPAMFGLDRPMIENAGLIVTFVRILAAPLQLARLEAFVRTLVPGSFLVILLFLVLGIVLISALAVLAFRRVPFLVFSLAGFLGLSVLLNVAQVLPFRDPRMFLFIQPVTLAVYAAGLTEAMARLGRILPPPVRRAGVAGVVALCAVLSIWGMQWALQRRTQEVRILLDEINRRAPDVPVWVYHGAQPAVALLAPASLRLTGLFDFSSGTVAWPIRAGGYTVEPADRELPWRPVSSYPATITAAVAEAPAVWLLFAHDFIDAGHAPFLEAAAAATGPCTLIRKANDATLYYCGAPLP